MKDYAVMNGLSYFSREFSSFSYSNMRPVRSDVIDHKNVGEMFSVVTSLLWNIDLGKKI